MLLLRVYPFLMLLRVFVAASELKIVLWTDPVQKDMQQDVSLTLKEIEALKLETEIKVSLFIVRNGPDRAVYNMDIFCEILYTEDISVIVDLTYYPWQQGLDYVSAHNIPYLRVDRMLSPYMQMFAEFMQLKDANDLVVIVQNEQDTEEALHQIVEGFPFRTSLVTATEHYNYIKQLREMRPPPSYYAIFAGGNNMNLIFDKIYKNKLFIRAREWHFLFLDTRDRAFKYRKQAEFATKFTVNLRAICRALQMKDSYCISGFTFQRAMLLEIFRSLSEVRESHMNWLRPMRYECNYTAPTYIHSLDFDLLERLKLTNFMTFAMTNTTDEDFATFVPALTYNLNVSINFYSTEHEAVTDLALWQSGELHLINETISPARRFFRIGTVEAIPWSYYRRNKSNGEPLLDHNGNFIWDGYCVDVINTLAEKMDFDYVLMPPTSGKYGARNDKTGHWDGLVGDLVRDEIDFAVAAMKMYSEREEVIDYIAPYFEQTGITIVIRKAVHEKSLFKFMTVLRVEVWMSIIAAVSTAAMMIWLDEKYSPYSAVNNKEAYPYPTRIFTIRECFWFALTSFTPQGGGEAPKAMSGRVLVAAYWLFVVLMLATFTANLAAFLTVERMQTPVQSLDQLARQSRINYTVVANSDTHRYFVNMKFAEDMLYRMWKELALNASSEFYKYRIWDYPIREQYGHILFSINASIPVPDAAAGFRKVSEHESADFAFIHDSTEVRFELTKNCNLTEVGEVFGEQPYAVAVQQGSHLTDEISYAILELQKDRYFEDLHAKYWNFSETKGCHVIESQQGISLDSLGGVFIATLFGLGLAMVTLALEVLYFKQVTSKKKLNQVTNVQPAAEENVATEAEETTPTHYTPPPTFDTATFRGRKIPPSITLGNEFKPRRVTINSRPELRKNSEANGFHDDNIPSKDSYLSTYME